jgi:hypothetical protein
MTPDEIDRFLRKQRLGDLIRGCSGVSDDVALLVAARFDALCEDDEDASSRFETLQ